MCSGSTTEQLGDPRLPQRFWAKVTEAGDCWEWTATTVNGGYGLVRMGPGPMKLAHRVAFETLAGLIPEGKVIDHLCRNRACVRPSHLEPVTQMVNVRRGATVTEDRPPRTQCKRGHAFTPENTRIERQRRGGVFQRCLTCKRDRRLRAA